MFSLRHPSFGIFSPLHAYFVEQYQYNQASSLNRLEGRAQIFWDLLSRYFSQSHPSPSSQASRGYCVHYEELLGNLMANSSMGKGQILEYFLALKNKIQSLNDEERKFYGWFLAQIALPIFRDDVDLTEEQFDIFLDIFSSNFLLEAQAVEAAETKSELIDMNLFVSLSSSKCSTAIERFCKIIKRLDFTDYRAMLHHCAAGVFERLESGVTSQHSAVDAMILQRLLVSVRAHDRTQAQKAIIRRYNNAELMRQIFCSDFMINALNNNGKSNDIFVDSAMIFDLLREAMIEHKILCDSFNQTIEYNRKSINRMNAANLSPQACAHYFAMLNKTAQSCYSVADFNVAQEALSQRQKTPSDLITQNYLLSFVMRCFCYLASPSAETKNELFAFYHKINNQSGDYKVDIASAILIYLELRDKLYGENKILTALVAGFKEIIEPKAAVVMQPPLVINILSHFHAPRTLRFTPTIHGCQNGAVPVPVGTFSFKKQN